MKWNFNSKKGFKKKNKANVDQVFFQKEIASFKCLDIFFLKDAGI